VIYGYLLFEKYNLKMNLTGSTAAFLDDFDVGDVTVTRSAIVQRPTRHKIIDFR